MMDLPTDWIGVAGLAIMTLSGIWRQELHNRTIRSQVKNGSTTKLRDDVDEILDGVRGLRTDMSVMNLRVTLLERAHPAKGDAA